MAIRDYLPSARFTTVLGALLISGAIVGGTNYYVHPPEKMGTLQASPSGIDWQQEFASSSEYSQDNLISEEASKLVQQSATNNLTETIGRSIFINVSAAAGQGSADSPTTQDQIIQDSLQQIQTSQQKAIVLYDVSDLSAVPDTSASLHDFGNALQTTLNNHLQATYQNTMYQVALATDNDDATPLSKLPAIAADYHALAKDIIALPVPVSLESYSLTIANNYAQMGNAALTLKDVLSDPVAGLTALQTYTNFYANNTQMFINIGNTFQKNAILFSKDEPGAIWSVLVKAQQNQTSSASTQTSQNSGSLSL
jgi:hypothetical protein